MSNRQGGSLRGNTYIGTKAIQPPDTHIRDRNPDQYDTNGYAIMDLWLNKVTQEIWVLVSLEGNSTSKGQLATWVQFGGGGGGAITFIANVGNATEAGGFLNVLGVSDGNGNTGARTNASGNTINIEITPVSFDGDAGTATPSNDTINILGGSGITTSAAGNTVTITAASGISSVPTDSGTAVPAGGVLEIVTNQATKKAGSTVFFRAAGNVVTLEVSDTDGNTIIGKDSGSLPLSGALGNTILGDSSGTLLSSGNFNTVVGAISGAITTGSNNTFLGEEVGGQINSGSNSIMIGRRSGNNCVTGNESSNIYIGNEGVNAESNCIRIGADGSGAGQQNATYIAGIYGATIGGTNGFVKVDSNGKLGSTASAPSDFTLISTQNPVGVTEVTFLNLTGSTYKLMWHGLSTIGNSGGVSANREIPIQLFCSDDNGSTWTLIQWSGWQESAFDSYSNIFGVPDATKTGSLLKQSGYFEFQALNNALAYSFSGSGGCIGCGTISGTKRAYGFGNADSITNVNALRVALDSTSFPGVTFNTGTFSLYEISV